MCYEDVQRNQIEKAKGKKQKAKGKRGILKELGEIARW